MSQSQAGPARPSQGTPRWVKVAGIIAIVLVVIVVILHLTGHSLGGPGSHGPHSSRIGETGAVAVLVQWP